jgi:hypothetical protein
LRKAARTAPGEPANGSEGAEIYVLGANRAIPMHGSLSKRKSFMEFEHGVLGVEAQSRRSVDRTAFPLSNETEVEESQEENGMDNGTRAADLRRRDKARA